MNPKINLLNIQMIATTTFIGVLILSLLLTYNQKLLLEKKEPIFNAETFRLLIILNRSIILILAFTYLYIDYTNYQIDKNSNQNLESDSIQLTASTLTLIAALIVLYNVITYTDSEANISGVTAPNA